MAEVRSYVIGGLRLIGFETDFGEAQAEYLRTHPSEILLFYDDVPRTPELHAALVAGDVQVLIDFDRGTHAASGFVVRVGGRTAKVSWPCF